MDISIENREPQEQEDINWDKIQLLEYSPNSTSMYYVLTTGEHSVSYFSGTLLLSITNGTKEPPEYSDSWSKSLYKVTKETITFKFKN